MKTEYAIIRKIWNGIEIEIRWNRDYVQFDDGQSMAHLEVQSIQPARARFPSPRQDTDPISSRLKTLNASVARWNTSMRGSMRFRKLMYGEMQRPHHASSRSFERESHALTIGIAVMK